MIWSSIQPFVSFQGQMSSLSWLHHWRHSDCHTLWPSTPKFNRRHGDFLKSTCDIELSDVRKRIIDMTRGIS